ncbi:amidohydrolase [Pedobacter frigidisoli]|uniref:Amidohydrolase n=1 Tax=Pedobacter frigidisoli TaxID=2530455 RepID=A0A4R0NAN0_9SPHI|nr:amidohydrolase family protein [Pedobacter frigidisoli]TCC97329.1 amidohydrolase [Pedobacter frigidisoli]
MKIITIEEHFSSAKITEKIKQFRLKNSGGIGSENKGIQTLFNHYLPTNDDIEDVGIRRIDFMDKSGVDMQVISYGGGSPQSLPDPALAIELCREANDELHELIGKNPTRFAGFATLPVADPAAAANELERAVKELGFKGAMLAGTFQGKFFDADIFYPIFAKAAELDVPIYMHPGLIDKNIADYYFKDDRWPELVNSIFPATGYGWHMDSGIHVMRMILSGIFDKLPDLKLISGHWGEFVPFFLSRIDSEISTVATNLQHPFSFYYKNNIYITPSGIFDEAQLGFAITVMGADHIIHSGDYPYLIDNDTRNFLEKAPISDKYKAKIGHLNIEKLLRL